MPDRADTLFDLMLDRYVDRVLRDEVAGEAPPELDPVLAATVRRLQTLNRAPRADAAYADRLWESLTQSHHASNAAKGRPARTAARHPSTTAAPPRRRHGATKPARMPNAPWQRVAATLAAALLVVIGLGVVLLGSGGVTAPWLPRPTPVSLQAPDGPAAASPETLVEVTAPASMTPAGSAITSCLSHITVPPHTAATWDAQAAACCPGTRLLYVVSGDFVVVPGEAASVVGAGGRTEPASAGSALNLSAGDALLLGSDTPFTADNPNAIPVELLQQILSSPADFPQGKSYLPGWHEHDYDAQEIALPSGAVTMRLQRVVLPALATPPPSTSELTMMHVVFRPERAGPPGDVLESRAQARATRDRDEEMTTRYVLTLEPVGAPPMP